MCVCVEKQKKRKSDIYCVMLHVHIVKHCAFHFTRGGIWYTCALLIIPCVCLIRLFYVFSNEDVGLHLSGEEYVVYWKANH